MMTMRYLGLGILTFLLSACGGDPTSEAPLKLPEREKTWVKTEEVEITKDDALTIKNRVALQANVDDSRLKKLMQIPDAKGSIKDQTTCLAALEPLDKVRMAVQREGGLWHAFERVDTTRPYSNNGVQLDSQMNKLVFSLRHLCETQQGVPMDSLAIQVNQSIETKGLEGTREELSSFGEAPKTIDQWIAYAEQAKKNSSRKVEFAVIESRLMQARPMIDLYEDLLKRPVDENNQQKFLDDSVTLLEALRTALAKDQYLVMALNEDLSVPYKKFRGEM